MHRGTPQHAGPHLWRGTANGTSEGLFSQSMTYAETKAKLVEVVNGRLIAAGKGNHSLDETTLLLGDSLALDSFELAAVVLEMNGITKKNLFAAGFIEFQTLGELARLYAD
jgi:hypothetical protein